MHRSDGTVLYVGKARNLKKRLSNYFSARAKDIKTAALMKHVADITVTITHDEAEALLLECNLVKKLQPHYNVIFRDDKSYPYILLTASPFPRITFHRVNKQRSKKREGQLFGPFADTTAVRETIILIEKIFKLRNCTEAFFAARRRPCIQYEIARCTAPCTAYISQEKYAENVRLAALFLQGKNTEVMKTLADRMEAAAAQLDYERAAKLRDQIVRLREVTAQQSISGTHGDADVAGFALSAGVACIQLLMIRNGRMSGSRAFFQHYQPMSRQMKFFTLSSSNIIWVKIGIFQKKLLQPAGLTEINWLENALCQKAGHKVVLLSGVRGDRRKWLEMATHSARNPLRHALSIRQISAHVLLPSRIKSVCRVFAELNVSISAIRWVKKQLDPVWYLARRARSKVIIVAISYAVSQAAMTQVQSKNYWRSVFRQRQKGGKKHPLPDVLLIDGGVPQLNAAHAQLTESGITVFY